MVMLLGGAAALVFFLLLPSAGAVYTQRQWRRFVRRAAAADREPLWKGEGGTRDAGTRDAGTRDAENGFVQPGYVRFTGKLESLQGEGIIWLRRGSMAVSVDAENSDLYIMTDLDDPLESGFPESLPEKTRWKRVSSAVQGTQFFVRGIPEKRGGQWFLGAPGNEKPLVILFEGDEERLIPEAVWQGRSLNEFWNPVTPWSLLAGFMVLLALSFSQQTAGAFGSAVKLLLLALIPILPLVPPGIFLFFLCRYWWRRGRSLRADRDLEDLGLGQVPGRFRCRAVIYEAASLACLAGAFALNLFLLLQMLPGLIG